MNFKDSALDIESLESISRNNREDLCRDAFENAKIRCSEWGIEFEKRI
jgi:hypothetical protein